MWLFVVVFVLLCVVVVCYSRLFVFLVYCLVFRVCCLSFVLVACCWLRCLLRVVVGCCSGLFVNWPLLHVMGVVVCRLLLLVVAVC